MKKLKLPLLLLVLAAFLAGLTPAHAANVTVTPLEVPGDVWQYLGQGLFLLHGPEGEGVIDMDGHVIVPPIYKQAITRVLDDTIIVAVNLPDADPLYGPYEHYGAYDLSGNLLIEPRYESISAFSDGYALTYLDGQSSIIDKAGNETPIDAAFTYGISEGLIVTNPGSEALAALYDWCVYDTGGNMVFAIEKDTYFLNSGCINGRFNVMDTEGRFGYLDREGRLVIPCIYDFPSNFSDGLACMTIDDKLCYIDMDGNIALETEFLWGTDFVNGFAAVALPIEPLHEDDTDYYHYYMNKSGDIIAPMGQYPADYYFAEGYAISRHQDGTRHIINAAGEVLVRTDFTFARPTLCVDGTFYAYYRDQSSVLGIDYLCTLVDTEGRSLVPREYHVLGDLWQGAVLATNGDYFNPEYFRIEVGPATDVPASWAEPYIERLKTKIAMPYFLLEDFGRPITRDAFTALVVNTYEALAEPLAPPYYTVSFSDIIGNAYAIHINKAHALGLVDGVGDGLFAPGDTLTREQMAKMLCDLVSLVEGTDIPETPEAGYADDGEASPWAASYIAYCRQTGILAGVGENRFAPKAILDVQTALTAVSKLLEARFDR